MLHDTALEISGTYHHVRAQLERLYPMPVSPMQIYHNCEMYHDGYTNVYRSERVMDIRTSPQQKSYPEEVILVRYVYLEASLYW
jgi:hypothetical protein